MDDGDYDERGCGGLTRKEGSSEPDSATVGYTAVAIFAAMYAALEETRATCHWDEAYRPKNMRTEACIRANPEGKCGVGDDWVEACSGMCNCEGYIERPSTVVFVMSMIGLVVICVFGRETGLSSDRNRSNRSNRNNNGRVSLQVRELETPGGDHDDGSFYADDDEDESGTASFLQGRDQDSSSSRRWRRAATRRTRR